MGRIRRQRRRLRGGAHSRPLAAVATVLTLGLWNMVWGRSAITSQALMHWRVALQFIALCLVMAALYLSVK
jgi:Hypoxia induced protein conserved region